MHEDAALLARMRGFHGHIGPWAMLGYRAGLRAVRELDAPTHFGIHAEVHCPPQPPPSCFLDGVQFSTGCTMGKRNIELVPADEVSLTLTVNDSGATITVRPRPELPADFVRWLDEVGDEAASRRVLSMGEDELFVDDI